MPAERLRTIVWDRWQREQWKERWEGANRLNRDPFQITRHLLLMHLPPHVTGVRADVAYPSPEALLADLGLREQVRAEGPLASRIAIVVGQRFLLPAADAHPVEAGALRRAADWSGDPD